MLRILAKIFIFLTAILLGAYLIFLFLIPFFLQKNLESFVFRGNSITIKNPHFKSDYALNYFLASDELIFTSNDNNKKLILSTLSAKISLLNLKNSEIYFDNFSFHINDFKRSNSNSNFNISNLPKISFKKGEITYKTNLTAHIFDFTYKGNHFKFMGDLKSSDLNFIVPNKPAFINNFSNFKGAFDANFNANKNEITGKIKFNSLSALCIPLSVPIFFDDVTFNFNKNELIVDDYGFFGGEKTKLNLYVTNLFSKNREVTGNVSADITNAFSKKYIDGLFILNKVFLNVEFLVKNGVSNIFYTANIPIGSDLNYSGARLGLIDKSRTFEAVTVKSGDKLDMIKYAYKLKNDELIFGSAKFSKKNGKFSIDSITGETRKNAPISLLGFLDNRLLGGFFNGILEYNFNSKKLTGTISLTDSKFKDFKINDAILIGKPDNLSLYATGTLYNEPYSAEIQMQNALRSDLKIKLLDLYLKKFTPKPSNAHSDIVDDINKLDISDHSNITVDKINVRLDEFKKGNILFQNITLKGSAKDGILNLITDNILFANGIINIGSRYDYSNHTIHLILQAKSVDANVASYQFFNLKNQITGTADAKLYLKAVKTLDNLNGAGHFRITNGSLPNIVNKKFTINSKNGKNPYKFSLKDIIHFKGHRENASESTITGNFVIDLPLLKDIELYMQNNIISIFLNGDIDTDSELSNLQIWGKYDKNIEHEVKIFRIPLSWIMKFVLRNSVNLDGKFDKVPDIKGSNVQKFNIKIDGNLNDKNKLQVNFKAVN